MKVFLLLLLTAWSAKSSILKHRINFTVIWNVPTFQCASKKIPFTHLQKKYGIIQNEGDVFIGDEIANLYHDKSGRFPSRVRNGESNYTYVNGGVPQLGNLSIHLDKLRKDINNYLPHDFDGVAVIDMEEWKPIFRQNYGNQRYVIDKSYELLWVEEPEWSEQQIQKKAKEWFESAARVFMKESLKVAKSMRPRANWGFYGYPYCYNEACSTDVEKENDRLDWLWEMSDGLYPSVYSSGNLSPMQLVSLIRRRVVEAKRVARPGTKIYPFFRLAYSSDPGIFFDEIELEVAIKTMYRSEASGFIVWGSSSDVNTVEKCQKLLSYVNNVFGPIVAKHVTGNVRLDDEYAAEVPNGNIAGSESRYETNQNEIANKPVQTTTGNNVIPNYSNTIHSNGVNIFMWNQYPAIDGQKVPSGPGTDIHVDVKEINIKN